MPHFKDSFDTSSDVIYGTGLWIHIYLYNFYFGWPNKPIGKNDINLTPPTGTYDPYMAQAHDKYGTNVINLYNEPIHTKSFPVDKGTKTVGATNLKPVKLSHDTTTQGLAQDYIDHLKDCKHLGPDSIEGAISARLIRTLKKYQKMQGIDFAKAMNSSTTSKVAYHLYDVCIRRSCKYGVFYFTHVKSSTLHYILDEMDIDTIVNKVMVKNDTTNDEKVPICTSELRYIFRHWNGLKGKSLLFYDNYETCGAPWSDDKWQNSRAGWADYAIHRVKKYRLRIEAAISLVDFDREASAFSGNRAPIVAQKVITAFHALPATLTNQPSDDTVI